MLDIMPSSKLVIHEYRKHGTCSGLDPKGFFGIARRAYDSIKVPPRFARLSKPLTLSPDEVEKEFLAANPQLQPDMIAVSCSRNRLRDVRICFTRDLKLRSCGENELGRKLCTQRQITMPPVRYRPSGI
jgi:ribonuclease T2